MSEAYLDCAVEVKPVETEPVSPALANQRTDIRRQVDGVKSSVRQAGFYSRSSMHSVRVLDVSSGGISFESANPMTVGQKVELSIDTPIRDNIPAMGRVKYSIRWADGFRIGVEFTEISDSAQGMLRKGLFDAP